MEAQLDSYKLSKETSLGTDTVREEIPRETDREVGVDTPITMAQVGGGMGPPPIPPVSPILPIAPLVRPRGLPILVLQNLAAVDMPSHLPKFYGTKDEDLSRHMERYIERLASSLVTNP